MIYTLISAVAPMQHQQIFARLWLIIRHLLISIKQYLPMKLCLIQSGGDEFEYFEIFCKELEQTQQYGINSKKNSLWLSHYWMDRKNILEGLMYFSMVQELLLEGTAAKMMRQVLQQQAMGKFVFMLALVVEWISIEGWQLLEDSYLSTMI